jgi:membrane protease YdiL (CAAX protease family)
VIREPSAPRQIRALVVLQLRHWTRRALRPGDAPKRGFPSAFVLMAAALLYWVPLVWNLGREVSSLDGATRLAGTGVGLLGLFLVNTSTALGQLMPEMGKLRAPLRHSLLDELPLSPLAVLFLTWLQSAIYLPHTAAYLAAAAPELRATPVGKIYLGGFTLLLTTAAAAVGMALVSTARAHLPAHQRRRLSWSAVAAMALGYLALSFAGLAAPRLRTIGLGWLARTLVGGEHRAASLALLGGLAALGFLVAGWREARGYDRVDAAPPQRTRQAGRLTLPRAEQLMGRREQGRRIALLWIVLAVFVAAPLFVRRSAPVVAAAFGTMSAVMIVWVTYAFTLNLSSLMMRRDLDARAFLASLPLEPHETLAGKVAALRRVVMPVALLALPLAVSAAPELGRFAVTWRALSFIAAAWLLCSAAVPVAFLTNGLASPRAAGGAGSFATLLVGGPLLGVVASPNWFGALVSVATLGAIALEARRSALRCVRWIDDAGDVPRETPVWRALMVLAAFFAVQSLIALVLRALSVDNVALVYGGATLVLALLMHQEREHRPSLSLHPGRAGWLALGVASGLASGALALGFLKLLGRLDWLPHPAELPTAGPGLFIATVLMAPLAEEAFFRGWLQSAIAGELPEERRRRAIVYGALAFAAAHLGSLYVPQLVLGLIAGALYFFSGSLLPGILAHAAHNAVAFLY